MSKLYNTTCTNTQSWTVEDVLKAAEEGKKIVKEKQDIENRIRFLLRQYIRQTGDDWGEWAKKINTPTIDTLKYYTMVCPIEQVPQSFYDKVRAYFETQRPKEVNNG